jgi:transposase
MPYQSMSEEQLRSLFVVHPKYVYRRRWTRGLGASLHFASRMTVAQERNRDVLTQVKHAMTQVKHAMSQVKHAIRHATS